MGTSAVGVEASASRVVHSRFASLHLLDAERNLYQAQLEQVGAYRDQLVGQVAAFKALGVSLRTVHNDWVIARAMKQYNDDPPRPDAPA